MPSGVYVITNTRDSKRYVGVSADIESRWGGHRSDLRRGKHHSTLMQQAWNEFGEDAFTFEVLEVCGTTDFSSKEPSYIRQYRTNEPEYGYNKQYGEEMKYNPYGIALRNVGTHDDSDSLDNDNQWEQLEEKIDSVLLVLAMQLDITADDVRRFRELMAEIQL